MYIFCSGNPKKRWQDLTFRLIHRRISSSVFFPMVALEQGNISSTLKFKNCKELCPLLFDPAMFHFFQLSPKVGFMKRSVWESGASPNKRKLLRGTSMMNHQMSSFFNHQWVYIYIYIHYIHYTICNGLWFLCFFDGIFRPFSGHFRQWNHPKVFGGWCSFWWKTAESESPCLMTECKSS